MTTDPTPDPLRIPLAHSVRYAVRGLPELPYQYGRGSFVPTEITLTYRTAPDSQLGRVHAFVVGRIHVDGQEIPHAPYGQHYDEGLSNWPEWLTEEVRLHDPASAPAVPAGRDALVETAAQAIRDSNGTPEALEWWRAHPQLIPAHVYAAAVVAVLPPPADRAAVLREAADGLDAAMDRFFAEWSDEPRNSPYALGQKDAAAELRRMADEAQQQTELKPGMSELEAAARSLELDRDAASSGESRDYQRGMTRAVKVLRLLDAQPAVVAAVADEEPDTETSFVTRVLDLFAKADCHGELLWRIVDGQPEFSANVSDVFAWGGADCEEITQDTMPVLEQAFVELKALRAEEFIADLYAARLRKMRPQGAAYPSGTHKAWREVSALYDACGPERELGLGNPKSAPAHKAAGSQPGKEPRP